MELFYIPHNHQVLPALEKSRVKQEIVIDAFIVVLTVTYLLFYSTIKDSTDQLQCFSIRPTVHSRADGLLPV